MSFRDPDALVARAKQLQGEGSVPDAISLYLEAGLGYLFGKADAPSARAALSAAYQLDPQNLDVIYNMGRADVLEGRPQEGLAKFIDVLRKSNVQHLPALFEAGCVYESMNQPEQALLAFRRVLDRNPMHLEATVHIGRIDEARGAKGEAIAYYLQAAEIARENRQFATARRITNMVLALDDRNQKARYLTAELDERGTDEDEPMPPEPPYEGPKQQPSLQRTIPVAARRPIQPGPLTTQPSVVEPVHPAAHELARMQPQGPAHGRQASGANQAEMEARRQGMTAEIERLAREKANLETTLAQERSLIEAALRRKAQLNTEIAQAQSNLGKHETELAVAEQRRRAEVEAKLQELGAALQQVQTETAAAKADLELQRAERAALEQTLQKLRSDVGSMARSKLDEESAVSVTRDKARADLDAALAETATAKAQLDEARAGFERNVAVWEDRITRLRAEIEQLEAHRAKLLKSRA